MWKHRNFAILVSIGVFWATLIPLVGGAAVNHNYPMEWQALTSGTGQNLNDIWGSDASDIFVVGDNGTILHYDGISWNIMSSPTSENIVDIWGRGWNDVYAVGDLGTQIHYNGSTWSSMGAIPHPVGRVSGISGNSTDVYCSTWGDIEGGDDGADIMKLYGGNWESRDPAERYCPIDMPDWVGCLDARRNYKFNGIHVNDNSTVYTGGWDQIALRPVAYADKVDISSNFLNSENILGVWGINSSVYFVGINNQSTPGTGIVSKLTNGVVTNFNLNTDGAIWDAWGPSENNVFFAASNGQVYHFNGSGWIDSITGSSLALKGVWGASDEDVYVVGDYGTILHYEGLPPATLDLVTPTDGSVQGGNTVSFDWDPVPWATSYNLKISETDDMNQLVLDSNVGNITEVINLGGFLDYGRPYFWQVEASDGFGHSVFSDVYQFDNGVAISPILITPRHASNVSGTSVRFAWYPFESSTHYFFQLSYDANFTNIAWNNYVYDTEVTLNNFGDDGTPYYWRVVGIEDIVWGNYWSQQYLFVNGSL